jgi:hypothetical protein
MSTEPTLEERVTRIEQLIEQAIAYGRRSAFGRALLAKLGLADD